ncbi:MAG: ribonucleoside-diphosphate reductase subunit alpha [Verrucomicrobiota bacterium]
MIDKQLVEEDLHLKDIVSNGDLEKPRFDWAPDDVSDSETTTFQIQSGDGDEERKVGDRDIAGMLGEALTDLLLSKREDQIYTTQNREMVADLTGAVSDELARSLGNGESSLSNRQLTALIERALIKRNAHALAKSFIVRQGGAGGGADPETPSASPTVKIIRRNGGAVPWNTAKIEIAVRKAFLSLELNSAPAGAVAEAVAQRMAKLGQAHIHIEDLQDRVQEELMRQGHYKVAAAYILYRAHRSDLRAQEEKNLQEPKPEHQDSLIVVERENGETLLWDGSELRRRIEFAAIGLDLCLSIEEIEVELRRSTDREKIAEEDLRKTVILNAKALIERDADFSHFAGRILLTYIYEEVLGWDIQRDGIERLGEFHRKAFRKNLLRGIEIKRLNPDLTDLDLDRLAAELDPAADLDFEYLGVQTLYDRYLIVDKQQGKHRRLETPQLFWMRVSMGLFLQEGAGAEEKILGLYRLYKGRRFCSSTPTLFNSGTLHSQLSSCYLYKVDDSIESIMHRGVAENAFLSKWAGGLGGSWTAVRGTGSYIQGTNGESQGVIPFLKLHNDQLVAVNQGGKRRGSGCAYLESWHNDIFDFLELRRNVGDERRRTHDMNTANWIPDLFMKRLIARESWTLFRSNEVSDLHDLYGQAFEERYVEYEGLARAGEIFGRVIPALDLWKKMLANLFETGHPWITFKDPCNLRSPQDHVGVVHSSNLCTEITLNTSEEETAVCNLGSVVIDSHLDDEGNLDHEKLRETIQVAVEALDNVIDINFYPTESARTSNMRHRPIGLGVMGLQNALYKRDVSFASDEAIEFNDEMMEAIAYYAYEASSDLAKRRGSYSTFEGSKWHRGLMPLDTLELLEQERGQKIEVKRGGRMDWDALRVKIKEQGMRNSNVLAIAPTATISNIMGSTPCIEPSYKNLFVKSNLSGDFIVLNQYLVRDLKARDLWNRDMLDKLKYFDGELQHIDEIPEDLKKKYITAFKIEFRYLIDAAARRQKWIDQSQSLNLFLEEPDVVKLSATYKAAWLSGLKTTYYLRTLGASHIEKATVQVKKDVRGSAEKPAPAPAGQFCSLSPDGNAEDCEACQ